MRGVGGEWEEDRCRKGRKGREREKKKERKKKEERNNDPYLKWKIQNRINNLVGINVRQELTYKILKVNNFQFKHGW